MKHELLASDGKQALAELETFLASEEKAPLLDNQAWAEVEAQYGPDFPSDVLYVLTRKSFEPQEARRYWLGILNHRRALRRVLGRDLGLRAALCDYFVNIEPAVKSPLILEEELFAQKEQTALCDELTGLFNRRFFNSVLAKQIATSQRYDQVFSLMLLDVDWFKVYNDCHGHLAGDQALVEIAGILQNCARDIDYVVRYGGEEFAVILPQADKEHALGVAERYREAVMQHHFPGQEVMPRGRLTVSLGVATFPMDATDALGMIDRADQALYQAKRQGRNQAQAAQNERRGHPRVPFRGQAKFRYLDDARAYQQGQTMDISQTGLRLRSSRAVEAQRPLEIVLTLGDKDLEVTVEGAVVRVALAPGREHYHLGVALDQSPASYHDYQRLVDSKLATLQ